MASIFYSDLYLLLGALLVLAGVLSSLMARRFGVPLLLVFLVLGMLAGEDGPGGIQFDQFDTAFLIGSGALAIILFEGGLRTKLADFQGVLAPAVLLSTLGVLVTAGSTGLAAMYLLGLDFVQSLILGAIVASTDAAAVFFLLRSANVELRGRLAPTLEIESATNDPMAVFFTFILVEIALAPTDGWSEAIIASLASEAILGAVLGVLGGLAISWLLNHVELPDGLHPLLVGASALGVFGLTALIGGSGFLAVYLAGLIVGNRPVRAAASIASFHDTATWLCQIVMFLVLGLLATPSRILDVAMPGLGVALFLMLIGRPAAVTLCLLPFGFTWREIAFVGWVGLRGAVSIFLAVVPMLSVLPSAVMIFDVAFLVVLVSLIVQGWTIRPVAHRLGLVLPRATRRVHRTELDLPGQLTRELVGYPVMEGSAILAGARIPSWSRMVMIVRESQVLDPREAGGLRPDDYAYMLTPAARVGRLDRLFASPTARERGAPMPAEFSLDPSIELGMVAGIYGIELQEEDRQATIAAYFTQHFEGRPEPGDHLPFGDAELVVREVDEDRVVRVGLLIDGSGGAFVRGALATHPRLHRLARQLRLLH